MKMNGKLKNQAGIVVIFTMSFLTLFLFFQENSYSQEPRASSEKLVVGVIEAPPIFMKTNKGQWEGLGVDIWKTVAQDMGVSFEFREYRHFGLLLQAIEKKEIDLTPSLPAEVRYELTMDLSQSYFKSGLAIAVPSEGKDFNWIGIAAKIFSKDVMLTIGQLILLSLIAGTIVFLFERRQNWKMFGEGTLKGIGHGIWWSVVTMTTVGYGDKAPKSIGGRIVAIIWMLFSLVFIAGFVANITASMTVSELRGKVHGFDDLRNVRVGSITQSESENFLSKKGISNIPFENVPGALKALADNNIDAFVLNEHVLKYAVKKDFQGRVQVLPGIYDEYFVVMALKKGHALRKNINTALLKLMKTEKWHDILNRYIQ